MAIWMVEIRMPGGAMDTLHIRGEKMENILSYLYRDIKSNHGNVTSTRIDGQWFYIDSMHGTPGRPDERSRPWHIVGRPAIIIDAPSVLPAPNQHLKCGHCGKTGCIVPNGYCKPRSCNVCHYECGGIVNGEHFTCSCRCHGKED